MTAEMQRLSTDPNFIVSFAVGDPIPPLIAQDRSEGINFCNVFFNEPKRYILKKAHLSRDDNRIFEHSTGKLIMISHHPGKNPYECTDPLGLTNQDKRHAIAGGEWESICDVSARGHGFQNFKIRPKKLSRHGRQFIKRNNGEIVFNVGKVGKFKTMSMRDNFAIGKGEDSDLVYQCVADMMGRTLSFTNSKGEVVAQMAKSNKALLQTAVFGSGSESTIDIAPGVDCSTILAIVFGIKQVGAHFMGDAFNNYVMNPAKDSVIDGAVEAAGLGEAVNTYSQISNSAFNKTSTLTRTGRFVYNNFFQ